MLKLERKQEGGKKNVSTRDSKEDEDKNENLGASIHK
jgi:hypothetical protein